MKVNEIENLAIEEGNEGTSNCDGCGKLIDVHDEESDQIPIDNGRHVIDVMISLWGVCNRVSGGRKS